MIIGVDIGGTKIAVAGFARGTGDRLERPPRCAPSRHRLARVVRPSCRRLADAVRAVRGGDPVEAVGVGNRGCGSGRDGTITSATDAISGWVGSAAECPRRCGRRPGRGGQRRVHAAAVAEAERGAGAGADAMLMVAVGTGIGGAVVLADGLRRGVTGTAGVDRTHGDLAAPEPRRAPLPLRWLRPREAVASGPALEQTFF